MRSELFEKIINDFNEKGYMKLEDFYSLEKNDRDYLCQLLDLYLSGKGMLGGQLAKYNDMKMYSDCAKYLYNKFGACTAIDCVLEFMNRMWVGYIGELDAIKYLNTTETGWDFYPGALHGVYELRHIKENDNFPDLQNKETLDTVEVKRYSLKYDFVKRESSITFFGFGYDTYADDYSAGEPKELYWAANLHNADQVLIINKRFPAEKYLISYEYYIKHTTTEVKEEFDTVSKKYRNRYYFTVSLKNEVRVR